MASLSLKRLFTIHRSVLCHCRQTMDTMDRRMATDGAASGVQIVQNEGKAIVTLNRPKQLNSLNLEMIRTIYSQLRKWEMDPNMRLVIVRGAGEKSFCAGGDVKAIAQSGPGSAIGQDFFREEYRLNNQIGSLSIPYVAFINGIVMGGGVGLSVHGAFRVATEKSVFAMPETAIGFFPDVGGSHFLPRLPGKLGLYLALTGHRLQGRDLFKAGIATHFLQSDKLDQLQEELCRLEKPDLKAVDKILVKYQEQWEDEHRKEFELKKYIGRINSAFGNTTSVEQIITNLRKDTSDWAKKTVGIMEKVSPTSLKVTFRQIQEGAKMSLPECLRMEYGMSQKFMAGHDFYEGVRAILIDKDQNPKWNPASLSDVTDTMVDDYFQSDSTTLKALSL